MKIIELLACIGVLAMSAPGQSREAQLRSVPELKFLMRIFAPLEAPAQVTPTLIVFQPRGAGSIAGPNIKGELITPTGDWVRIQPNGSMRIDVRGQIRLDDGSLALVTYGGVLSKPSPESWTRFMSGEKISSPEWHYVVAPTFETGSSKYGWLNDVQAVGKFVSI
jgi:uncharacterized protein DUF3237